MTHMVTLPVYRLVWFNGEGIAKILYMANTTKKYPVSYDSKADDRFILHKADEKPVSKRSPSSLYFHDTGDWEIIMVASTTGNCKGYTDRKFVVATESQEGLAMVGNPSSMDYINMVCSVMIQNFPVTPEAVSNSNKYFGLDVASLKGKTTRQTSNPVVKEYVETPQKILDLNKKVTTTTDAMFVNELVLSLSTSLRIKFTTL